LGAAGVSAAGGSVERVFALGDETSLLGVLPKFFFSMSIFLSSSAGCGSVGSTRSGSRVEDAPATGLSRRILTEDS
jgi:hypothetical protein